MFKRILVPLDGSPRAMRALPVAARLARASGRTVVLVQAATVPLDYNSAYNATSPTLLQETIDTELEVTNRYLERVANSGELVGVKVETIPLFGSPAQAILSAASTYPVDLIVMCSHGITGLKRWAMGSVALKLARYSPVPVLVLRQDGPIPGYRRDATRPLRIVVPLDGSVLAKAAVLPAAQLVTALANQSAGALHFVRVVKLPPDIEERSKRESLDPVLREQVLHKAKIYLDSIVRQLREGPLAGTNLSITWSVVIENDAAEGITSVAENGEDAEGAGAFGGCDIIAMATHGRGGLQRWAMGSVTERVLGHTRLPVLVVRSHEAETKPAVKAEEPAGIKMPVWVPLK